MPSLTPETKRRAKLIEPIVEVLNRLDGGWIKAACLRELALNDAIVERLPKTPPGVGPMPASWRYWRKKLDTPKLKVPAPAPKWFAPDAEFDDAARRWRKLLMPRVEHLRLLPYESDAEPDDRVEYFLLNTSEVGRKVRGQVRRVLKQYGIPREAFFSGGAPVSSLPKFDEEFAWSVGRAGGATVTPAPSYREERLALVTAQRRDDDISGSRPQLAEDKLNSEIDKWKQAHLAITRANLVASVRYDFDAPWTFTGALVTMPVPDEMADLEAALAFLHLLHAGIPVGKCTCDDPKCPEHPGTTCHRWFLNPNNTKKEYCGEHKTLCQRTHQLRLLTARNRKRRGR